MRLIKAIGLATLLVTPSVHAGVVAISDTKITSIAAYDDFQK